MTENQKKIAIIGGTGKEGKGLAFRWARAGHDVVIGSRVLEKAQTAADEINLLLTGANKKVSGKDNLSAASEADIVVLTVPYNVHKDMLVLLKEVVQNKILIDVTVPLVPPKVSRVQMPPAGSAALEAREILGGETKLVSAFQNISYEKLLNDEDIECDVLVSGDKEARALVIEMIKEIGLKAWDAGPLENSMIAEGLTSILIGINKQFGIQSAGIKITGIPGQS
jgi:8-hydroxy-5-deazaflavin:NADPH oxidoreductase